jgi:hypothetical protein
VSNVPCGWRRHVDEDDVAVAVFFVALDTAVTLVGGSWWPADPDGLASVLLAAQALTGLSLVARRRAPVARRRGLRGGGGAAREVLHT